MKDLLKAHLAVMEQLCEVHAKLYLLNQETHLEAFMTVMGACQLLPVHHDRYLLANDIPMERGCA